ncbi:MAG: hypothetical protein ACOC9V_05825 [Chloroflexota bacterium]
MRDRVGLLLVVLLIAIPLFAAQYANTMAWSDPAAAPDPDATPAPAATPTGHVATQAELDAAYEEWEASEHAHTFDGGMGANTTCAKCKSPLNWDPSQEEAQQLALDCGSCKREPGAPRPDLAEGVPVPEEEWQHITCDVCHMPAGDSFYTGIAFWNQESGRYEEVADVDDLCARCHEGQHGFRVIEEQEATAIHGEMACTECHGAHGADSACTDCHDPTVGPGAFEHERHPSVACSGCHDAEGLSVWQDPVPESDHFEQYITRRFAHTLTSWPSHNLTMEVDCLRCHHPPGERQPVVVPYVSCTECHEHADGAVSEWCTYFERDPDPRATTEP